MGRCRGKISGGQQGKRLYCPPLPFGAFVRLESGIDGLIHISNLGAGRRINHPREVVEAGQRVEVYVLSVDPQNRKISLSMQPKVEPVRLSFPLREKFSTVLSKK